jgi:hypothetical protein
MQSAAVEEAFENATEAIGAFCEIPIERFFGPAEKINITVPAGILRQIDNFTKMRGHNRSAFLTQAALDAMRRAG